MNTETSKSLGRDLLLSALLCLCFLTFPLRVQADQAAPTFVNPLSNPTPAECLFNWAENNYPALFAPAGSPTQIWTVYAYRYYPATNTYLGVNSISNHVYYLGPDGVLQDEGPLADWTPKAGCPVPQPSPAECLFNWAEQNYPGLFAPAGSPWAVASIDWTYRYYALTNAYLGIQSIDNHVYYLGPDGNFQDEGQLADWIPKASCRPPVANAGPDQTATVGATVTLDGSASSDLDGDLITYRWTLTQKPTSSQTGLSNPTALHPTLAIDKPGNYVISLVVNDGQFDSAPATVTVNTQNSKPAANAGAAQTGKVGDTLMLDGSASHDVDGDTLTYHWTLPAKPQNSNAQFNNPDTTSPGLTLDQPGSYTAQLTVNDGKADSTPATVVLSTINSKPVAKAGPAQSLMLTTPAPSVLLDGSGSSDVDSDPLSFRWALISKPTGSQSLLLDPLAPSSRFTPDFVGDYVAQLIVNDGHADSDPNTIQISMLAPPPPQNHPPQISTSPVLTVAVGASYSYDVNAGDADNDTLTYSLSVFPSGMSINAQTGLISWTPGAGQTGPHSVTVNVIDGKGGSDSQSFTVTVASAGQITVPDLGNLSRAAAVTAIQQAKLNVGTLNFEHNAKADGSVINQSPAANSSVAVGVAVNLTISLGSDQGLPPNPETVAPAIEPTVATNVADSTKFLYSGPNTIQTLSNGQPLTEGTIEAKRAAVIRGRVLDKANNPLPGVTLSILNHPEFGQTLSRADGQFDLAVNGGGLLTVIYQKNAYLPLQRQLDVPWQDYVGLDDTILIARDATATTVDLVSTTVQIARGSVSNDSRGSRQATLLISPGTTAQVYNADGSTRNVTTLTLRATEYTVGDNGPQAMPAELQPNSAYTYAVELSADEAGTKLNGKDVLLNQPVSVYLENFLGAPVGSVVPVGYYDNTLGRWVASTDGRVIKVLSFTGGLADLDVNGDGAADSGVALTDLGITDAERERLATLYAAGQTLWREQLTHLSTWDFNWAWIKKGDDKYKKEIPQSEVRHNPPNDPCDGQGSIIECESQVLRETLPATGTPFGLNYRSDLVPGHKASRTVKIPVSGPTLPTDLIDIRLTIQIAGQAHVLHFTPAPNLVHTFEWDGLDGYGRSVVGARTVSVTLDYGFRLFYAACPPQINDGTWIAVPNRFGLPRPPLGSCVELLAPFPRYELARAWSDTLHARSPRLADLGGWSLDAHHVYDPVSNVLFLGDGSRLKPGSVVRSVITTVAGNGYQGDVRYSGDGGPATQARLNLIAGNASNGPVGMAFAPDGSLYFTDVFNNRIRRVGPDGVITTVAGNGVAGLSGDGGPAVDAKLYFPQAVALSPDGSLYISDYGNNRIRRVAPDGIISTVAGKGSYGFSGDGGPATQAELYNPKGIALAPDGSLYIADYSNARIRRVGPDGIITTVAGNGDPYHPFSGDGGPATQAGLWFPSDVAVAPDGNLYIADSYNGRVRRVGPDGIITTVAGGGSGGEIGGPATQVGFGFVSGIALAPDGSLYLTTWYYNYSGAVYRVGTDGNITAVAGTNGPSSNYPGFNGDGGPATQAVITPTGLAVAPDNSLYIGVPDEQRIRRISLPLPGYRDVDISVASEDGSELYQFSSAGRHTRTLNALTGATLLEFTYDAGGRLFKATDGDGNVTTVERNALGEPTAIIGPFGQRTDFTLDANGYLTKASNPAGEAFQIGYSADGLLQTFTDPNAHNSTMTYDSLGHLLKDENAAGGSQNLALTEVGSGYEVTRATALNRATRHQVESLATGDLRRRVVAPDGTQTESLIGANGSTKTTFADGSVSQLLESGDPRFGMQAPISKTDTVTTGGLTLTSGTVRTVSLTDPSNLLSLTSLTDKVTVNGRVSTLAYDAASKTFTGTSAAGRIGTSVIDVLGRPARTQMAGLLPVDSSYDTKGRLASITQGSGADARTLDFAYNAQGYLDTATDPLGRTVRFAYDAVGRVTRETLPDNREILYSYDANGNLKSLAPPGRPAHGFDYTAVDLPSQYTPPVVAGTGNTLYAYDLDKAPTSLTQPDGLALDYSYDSAGRLSKLSVPTGTATPEDYSYTYDSATGKLTKITAPDGGTLNYAYSGALPTQIQWTGTVAGTVNWAYDNDFRVNELKLNGADPIGFQYDADSLLKQAGALTLNRNAQNGLLTGSVLGKVADTLSYNGFGEVTGYTTAVDDTAVFATQYGHDKLGRIIQKQETLGASIHTYGYSYDLAGRLMEVKKDSVTTASYTYDDNGNRLTGPDLLIPATYDDQDRLTQYGGAAYTYTANGELETKTVGAAVTQYHYDPLGNLRTVTLPGGTAIEYLVDGQSRRIGKKINGTLVQGFLYQDGLKPIAELDGSGNVVSRFVYATHANVPDYMIRGGNTYRIVTDHLGSLRLVIDTADGSIVQRRDYDEFGRLLSGSFTALGFQQPFGFAGGLYDADTGLVRFGARDYDAETGRWTAKDPIGLTGGINVYEYADGDPISSSDIFGLCPTKEKPEPEWKRKLRIQRRWAYTHYVYPYEKDIKSAAYSAADFVAKQSSPLFDKVRGIYDRGKQALDLKENYDDLILKLYTQKAKWAQWGQSLINASQATGQTGDPRLIDIQHLTDPAKHIIINNPAPTSIRY